MQEQGSSRTDADENQDGAQEDAAQEDGTAVAVPAEASPGSPAHEPAGTTAAPGEEPEDAWRQGIHLASGDAADADGSDQARSGYWDDEDDPERPDET